MSNTKRRDNKGRVLQMGEWQQDDGRYVYRYTSPLGQRKSVYSWRLTASDPTPVGKRKEKSLREKIKDVEKQLRLELCCEDITVCELVEKHSPAVSEAKKNAMIVSWSIVTKSI